MMILHDYTASTCQRCTKKQEFACDLNSVKAGTTTTSCQFTAKMAHLNKSYKLIFSQKVFLIFSESDILCQSRMCEIINHVQREYVFYSSLLKLKMSYFTYKPSEVISLRYCLSSHTKSFTPNFNCKNLTHYTSFIKSNNHNYSVKEQANTNLRTGSANTLHPRPVTVSQLVFRCLSLE